MNVNERLVVAKKFKRLESKGKHCFVQGVKEHRWFDSTPESEANKLPLVFSQIVNILRLSEGENKCKSTTSTQQKHYRHYITLQM